MSKVIPLTRGMFAVVDDDDYESLSEYKWHAHITGRPGREMFYAARTAWNGPGKPQGIIYMHRVILACQNEVDHRNGDRLDNRRENLRPSNGTQQNRNHQRKCPGCSADHIGIYRRPNGRWTAQITVNYKTIALGTYDTQEQAAEVRRAAAAKHYGADRVEIGS